MLVGLVVDCSTLDLVWPDLLEVDEGQGQQIYME